nr:MerR family transcriptional regulator [Salmonella sp. NCTC 7297]
MLQHLHEGRIDALRQLIYDCGREYPRAELVTHLLRPLRSKVTAHLPAVMTLREVTGMVSLFLTPLFALKATEKRPAPVYLLAAGISRITAKSGWKRYLVPDRGCESMFFPLHPAILAPELFAQRKWFLVTTGKLTVGQKKQLAQWHDVIASLELITL